MRVTHVIPTLSAAHGGPTEVALQLHRHMLDAGVASRVITTDRAGLAREVRGSNSVSVARAKPPARLNFATGLKPLLKSHAADSDVFHIHSVDTFPTSIASRVAVASEIPFVIQPHGAYDAYHRRQRRYVKQLYGKVVDRRYFRRASRFIVSSEREAEGVRSLYPEREILQVPLGVDPQLLAPNHHVEPRREVLFLGRLTPKKRVDLALRAFAGAALGDSGWRMTVAGPTDPRLTYDPEELAADLGISERITFVGEVDATARELLLRRSAIFVLPSEDESFGVAVAEAMAAGCCVISTPEVGVVPTAAEEEAVVQVSAGVDALTRALASYAQDDAARLAVSQRGQKYAREHFAWGTITGQLIDLYRSLTKVRLP